MHSFSPLLSINSQSSFYTVSYAAVQSSSSSVYYHSFLLPVPLSCWSSLGALCCFELVNRLILLQRSESNGRRRRCLLCSWSFSKPLPPLPLITKRSLPLFHPISQPSIFSCCNIHEKGLQAAAYFPSGSRSERNPLMASLVSSFLISGRGSSGGSGVDRVANRTKGFS